LERGRGEKKDVDYEPNFPHRRYPDRGFVQKTKPNEAKRSQLRVRDRGIWDAKAFRKKRRVCQRSAERALRSTKLISLSCLVAKREMETR